MRGPPLRSCPPGQKNGRWEKEKEKMKGKKALPFFARQAVENGVRPFTPPLSSSAKGKKNLTSTSRD